VLGCVPAELRIGRTNGDMPTYEYRCTQCGVEFELFQQMSDARIDECPECGGQVQRLISSGGALLFKGTGFYATDYRSGGPSSASEESDSSSKKEKSAGKSDSGSKKEKSTGKSVDGSKKE
jgi:putative FmdB family regulatory protein